MGIITITNSNNDFGEPSPNDIVKKFSDRWPEIEAMLESYGRDSRLDELIIEYLKDLKKDNKQVQLIRNIDIVRLKALKLEIEDYSKDENLRTCIREYNDSLTAYADRMKLQLLLHHHTDCFA